MRDHESALQKAVVAALRGMRRSRLCWAGGCGIRRRMGLSFRT